MFGYKSYTISAQSFTRLFLFLALAIAIFFLHKYILVIITAVIIAMVLRPAIAWLVNRGVIRELAVLSSIVVAILAASLFLILFTPLFEKQIQEIISNLPQIVRQLNHWFNWLHHYWSRMPTEQDFKILFDQYWQNQTWSLGSLATSALASLLKIILFFGTVFYCAWEVNLWEKISKLAGKNSKKLVILAGQLESRLSRWAMGQLMLCLVIFLLTFLALSLLGVRYSLLLSILAGLLEAVPYVGPLTTAVVVGLFTLANQPDKLIWVLLALYAIQFLENHLLVPQIMAKAIGANALSVILVLLAASKSFGLLGTFLAVPILVIIKHSLLLWQDYKNNRLQKYVILQKPT